MSDTGSDSKRGLGDLDVFATGPSRQRGTPTAPQPTQTKMEQRETLPEKRPSDRPKAAVSRRPKVPTRGQVFYLPDDQIARLKKLSQATDRSKSDLAREAIGEYLDRTA